MLLSKVSGVVKHLMTEIDKHLFFLYRFIKLKWLKAVEAMAVAMVTGLVSFTMLVGIDTCTDKKPYDDHAIVSQVGLSRDVRKPNNVVSEQV